MKKLILLSVLVVAGLWMNKANAQITAQNNSIAVLHIDTKNVDISPAQMSNMTRLELKKLDYFSVMDPNDLEYLTKEKGLTLEGCYGAICALQVGEKLGLEKVLTGRVEKISDYFVIEYNLVDVASKSIEKTKVVEYLNISGQLKEMINMTLKKLLNLPVDEEVFSQLTKKYEFESSINLPNEDKLNLDGPRTGLVFYTGHILDRYRAEGAAGGYDILHEIPAMVQFGYQFETTYLNAGKFQALFEVIPSVTGLDKGLFIPSVILLNGFRMSNGGWEVHFGPLFFVNKIARGYFDGDGKWTKLDGPIPSGYKDQITGTLDKRGELHMGSAFVFGLGKSFRSGRLNIPVNVFYIPGNAGDRFGVSVGFNTSRFKTAGN